MPIIRRRFSFEGHFTQIPNAWLRDPRLALRSKGLLAQLLSHTEGWSVTIQSLARENGCGRDAIRASVRELEAAGYLTRRQDRTEGGEFAEIVWETSEPMTAAPLPDNPMTVNPTLKKTNLKKTKVKKHERDVIEAAFEQFWDKYPRKVGKQAARRSFEKAAQNDLSSILIGLDKLLSDPNLPPTQFIPYPATWLNREGWSDDPYPQRDVKPAQRPAEGPGKRAWVRALHDQGEHWECRSGEFGCK